MQKHKEIYYNLLLLFVIYVLTELGIAILNRDTGIDFPTFLIVSSFFLVSAIIYFINYIYVVPKLLIPKKYFLFGIAFVLLVFSFAGIRFLLEEVILFQFTQMNNYNLEAPGVLQTYLSDSLYYTFIIVSLSSSVKLLVSTHDNSQQIHRLEIEHQKAQMAALKSQISPHFLFNTLNSFYVELFDTQPEVANDILKLCNLLRYVTYETEADFISLEKEILFIKDYLYFFERRYENNFYVELEVNGLIVNQQIPSLMFVHFVENVCKHGIITQQDKPAYIYIDIKKDSLEITTQNYINTSDKYHESGIGTANIKKRLEVLFKNNFELHHEVVDQQFNAYLRIPLQSI